MAGISTHPGFEIKKIATAAGTKFKGVPSNYPD
jgi:hypothetical protein